MEKLNKPGYHLAHIPKGIYGAPSKILEEAQELMDAHEQGCKIMEMVELSDLYGAIETYAKELGLTMDDLATMSTITKRAFRNGHR